MSSHFSTIGFLVRNESELQDLAAQVIKNGLLIKTRVGFYTQLRERNGAEIWVQQDQMGRIIGVDPHFAGKAVMRVGLVRDIPRPDSLALYGAYYGWANPNEEEPQNGEYPLAFDSPGFSLHHPELPTVVNVQIAAFAHELHVYPDQKAFHEAGTQLAVESFIPSGLFTPQMESIEPPQAYAILTGKVIRCAKLTNGFTGGAYQWALVRTLSGEVDVLVDPELLQNELAIGNIITGSFWLSGRFIDPKQEALEKRLNGYLNGNIKTAIGASQVGEKIVLDPDILQPADVLDWKGYRDLLQKAKWNQEETSHLHSVIQTLPKQTRHLSYEWEQYDVLASQFRTLMKEYRSRLPIQLLAQCPYCGTYILQPVDVYSLMGFHGNYKAIKTFHGHEDWREFTPYKQICPHALCATFSVDLHGRTPDDLSPWLHGARIRLLDNAPYVMIWPLIARYTSAVMHALPIGRMDDDEPTHHYTMHIVTYFVREDSNLRTPDLWISNEFGQPATGAVWYDVDLLKWVRAGRLFWMDPENTLRLVQGPPESFPFTGINPGWYDILPNGQLDGPNPYRNSWNGWVPSPDESYARSFELDDREG